VEVEVEGLLLLLVGLLISSVEAWLRANDAEAYAGTCTGTPELMKPIPCLSCHGLRATVRGERLAKTSGAGSEGIGDGYARRAEICDVDGRDSREMRGGRGVGRHSARNASI
jgi:hypothetical protein